MTAMSNLTRARTSVLRWMPDTCTITRPAGRPTFDDETGTYPPVDEDDLFSGPCRAASKKFADVVVSGEAPITLRRYDVWVPWDEVDVVVDDIVTFTGSNDPFLIDRRVRIIDVHGATDGVTRHLLCEDTLTTAEEVGS